VCTQLSGEGGCNTLTGSFTIAAVTYVDNVLQAIDLTFEQHCEGGTPALHGSIKWDARDQTRPPDPVFPVPDGLWQPAPGSTPPTGNFVYLNATWEISSGRVRPSRTRRRRPRLRCPPIRATSRWGSVARRLERRFPDDETRSVSCNPATTLISCGTRSTTRQGWRQLDRRGAGL